MIVHCAYDEMISIDQVRGNPLNPNIHPKRQIKLLAQIIKSTGWRAPITISRLSGLVVRGHGRLEAAKLLKLSTVPVDYQDYADQAEEYADLLADNRLTELTKTDDNLLAEIMEKLEEVDFDIDLSGYNEKEVEKLLTRDDVNPVSSQIRVHIRALTRNLGAYFVHTLSEINGDRLKAWKTGKDEKTIHDKMVYEFVNVCQMRPAYFEAVTVPPPSYKRKSYDGYPIAKLAREVSREIGKPFHEVFEIRKQISKRSVHGRLDTDHEPFKIRDGFNLAGSYLVLDDITTTGRTVQRVQQALEEKRIPCFIVTWAQWGH